MIGHSALIKAHHRCVPSAFISLPHFSSFHLYRWIPFSDLSTSYLCLTKSYSFKTECIVFDGICPSHCILPAVVYCCPSIGQQFDPSIAYLEMTRNERQSDFKEDNQGIDWDYVSVWVCGVFKSYVDYMLIKYVLNRATRWKRGNERRIASVQRGSRCTWAWRGL